VRPAGPSPLPLWVRLLDAATTVLAGLGLLLEVTGGPRFTIVGLPVSMASGTRPLLFAAGLALVRHLLFRRDPLHRRLLRAYDRRRQTTFTKTIVPVFLTTRIAVLLVGYLAVRTIGFAPGALAPSGASLDGLGQLMLRWDAGWYYQIADVGYRFDPAEPSQQNIAFFPAYPLLMRYVGYLLGHRLLVAGLIVSLGAFLGAMVYLFRLARQSLDEDHASAAVIFLACYPFAIFYGAVYTESVFLLGTVGAFYHLSRGEHVRASAWGLLVGLTRPNGFFVSVPLLVVAARPVLIAHTRASWRWLWGGRQAEASADPPAERPVSSRDTLVRLAVALMPIIGMLIFGAYLYHLTGDPFIWRRAHTAWGRTYQGLSGVASGAFRYLIEFGLLSSARAMPFETLNSLAATFALALIWPVTRRFGLAYGLLVTINTAVPLMAGGVLSMGRLTAVLFPMFLWLGAAIPARHRPAWLFVFGLGQALVAVLFFTWRQVF